MSDFSCHPTGGWDVVSDLFYRCMYICFCFVYGTWEAVTKLFSHSSGEIEADRSWPFHKVWASCTKCVHVCECACARVNVCVFMAAKKKEARQWKKFPFPTEDPCSSHILTAAGKARPQGTNGPLHLKSPKEANPVALSQTQFINSKKVDCKEGTFCSQPSSPHSASPAKLATLCGAVCLGLADCTACALLFTKIGWVVAKRLSDHG
jgi:hypothetical protein